MALYQYSWLILFAPLLSFALIIFGTRMWDLASRPRVASAKQAAEDHGDAHADGHGGHEGDHGAHGLDDDDDPKVAHLSTGARTSAYLGIFIMLLSCIYSWVLLLDSTGVLPISGQPLSYAGMDLVHYSWGSASFLAPFEVRFHVDHLALAMLVVVTTISLLVQVYSQGYMENSAGYARFFSYLSLFTFSMLVIVFAANFLVIFVGWELVGLSSYLLIGFWINKRAKPAEDRPSPATAAMQAFVVNRIGDVGFIIGIMILFWKTGTFDFATLVGTGAQSVHATFAGDATLLTIAMILVFCGAIGKSAQIPLQIWLPNAMEGPTPVSALIHAATMVAAGVYMVARTFPLFAASGTTAFTVVAWVGTITALYAALTALTQTDFKRVLAYSTVSQLGYMFVGLGVAGAGDPAKFGPGPGMFHLFTHAFFKALLFLAAGSVIHNLHHATHEEVQDMRKMGGLAKYMPITAATYLVAAFTISGFPFIAGFYSKDTIIGLAHTFHFDAIYWLTLATAGLTAFYMFRAYIVAFGGKDGKALGFWGGTYRGVGTPHEAPRTITLPLILLALASIVAGYWFGLFSYLTPGAENISFNEIVSDPLTWLGVAVAFAGIFVAWLFYGPVLGWERVSQTVESNALLRFLHRLTLRKFYLDDLYYWLTKYIFLGLAHIAAAFDASIVDGIVNGVAGTILGLGKGLRRTETGKVQSYMYGFFGGIAALAILVFVLFAFAQGGVKLW
ncbi:MAG TPA: NADH-quinone oxidoreductase subunit L [Ktedonobacteraceae bacterium]|nr:NADH-quinone oxidoreductase subunit L [Ktedonobacteraceae bacterium]